MRINNYWDHNKLKVCSPGVYQHSGLQQEQQQKACERRPYNFHLITMIKAHICFHRLCIFITFFLWQKLQLLLMTGNLKVPLLNSHRCHVV